MLTHAQSTSQQHSCAAWLRRARLWSGMVLVAYLTTHLANHALGLGVLHGARSRTGLVSAARAQSSGHRAAVWGAGEPSRPGVVVPLSAPTPAHVPRGSRTVAPRAGRLLPYSRPTSGTRLAHAWFDVTDFYTAVVLGLWCFDRRRGAPGPGRAADLAARLCWHVFLGAVAAGRGIVVWRRGSWRWPSCCQPWPSSDLSRRGEKWRRMPGNQDGSTRSSGRPMPRTRRPVRAWTVYAPWSLGSLGRLSAPSCGACRAPAR